MAAADTDVDVVTDDINSIFIDTALPVSITFGVLCIIGTIGNSFIVYVYVTKYPPSNFKYFVVILGLIDLMRCLFTIPAEIYTQYTWFIGANTELCKIKYFLDAASITFPITMLLLIAVDRHRKVCHPHGWQIQHVLAIRLSVALGIVCVVWSTPTLIFCGSQTFTMKHAGKNISFTVCMKDNAHKDTILPVLILIVLICNTGQYNNDNDFGFVRSCRKNSLQKNPKK